MLVQRTCVPASHTTSFPAPRIPLSDLTCFVNSMASLISTESTATSLYPPGKTWASAYIAANTKHTATIVSAPFLILFSICVFCVDIVFVYGVLCREKSIICRFTAVFFAQWGWFWSNGYSTFRQDPQKPFGIAQEERL